MKATFIPVTGVMEYDDLCAFTCSRGHCPDVFASDLAFTSGSGMGNYIGLCVYTCKYNFCPEPCDCLVYGSEIPAPPIVPNVTGYAALGLDSATYDPLCNFTCSHGYYPSDACSYEEVADLSTSLVFPSDDDLLPFDLSTSYSSGDGFLYDTPEPSNLKLNINLYGIPVVWGDIDCSSLSGEYAPGVDGDTLGCIATSVSTMAKYLRPGYEVYQQIIIFRATRNAKRSDYGLGSRTGLGVGSELHFVGNSDIDLTTSFDEVGLTPKGAAEFVGWATAATISESYYEFLCCQFDVLGQMASTAAMRIGVTTPPFGWDSPYEPDQVIEICENATIGSVLLTCAYNLTSIDPELLDDPDRNESKYVWPVLSTRGDHSGLPVNYIITNYANSAQTTTFTSATYPNGNYGQDLPA
ncbi:hypothetical protein sscle_03g026470 [Sclerotinia sclerotiorum 1980 UF-70]|uniref:Uncharacterized protein n=1 Tax=Sclerotinia sclerotiorum (strain ATCC 18683 / 1980 / Ss-1) TaxID=665079 RepID=A0A1D9PYV9_SCLS1|nr:hypothetical protein sscle_03g026470 [Sclerotinia sclerotiorum 1980 UF-70]